MKVIRDLDWAPEFERGSVVTFGEFDGVHRGHRVVLLETLRAAVVEGCPAVVVTVDSTTFTPRDDPPPARITTFEQKLELLEASEIDVVIELSAGLDRNDPDRLVPWMVDDVFGTVLNARAVVVGEDYHFGTARRRALDELNEQSSNARFRIVQIPVESRRTAGGEVISAHTIRRHLAVGEVDVAAEMLGRPHEIRSTVTPGDRRGRTIGFPTVNLPTPTDVQIPAEGVYAGWYLRPDGERLMAAINIGRRPTFYDNARPLIEAHLLDFRGDLYGEAGRLQFVARLRPERKFDGIDALRTQLARDIDDARAALPTS